jgi:uncharacterized membrane protein
MHHSNFRSQRSITPLPIAVFATAVGQIFASQFSRLTGFGIPIEDLAQPYISPEEPEGYAFAIWAVIFALALPYSAKQIFKDTDDEKLFEAIRPASALLFGLSSAWMISAQLWGNGFHLVVIIFAMLVAAIYLLNTLSKLADGTTFRRWVIEPGGLSP